MTRDGPQGDASGAEPEHPAGDSSDPPDRGGELVIPAAALVFAVYYFFTIRESPWTAQVGAFVVGSVLIVLCLVFMSMALWRMRRGETGAGFSDLLSPEDLHSGRLAVFVLTLLYVVLIPYGGFTLTSFFFLWLCMVVLGRGAKLFTITGVSFGITAGGYLLFIVAFNTRFPHGPFEALMDRLF